MNKNTRNRLKLAQKEARQGNLETVFKVPRTYNGAGNAGKYQMEERSVHIGPKSGVVSQNTERNMKMVILHNKNADGTKSTATSHVPINRNQPSNPVKKKNYGKLRIVTAEDFEPSNVITFEKIVPKKPIKIS